MPSCSSAVYATAIARKSIPTNGLQFDHLADSSLIRLRDLRAVLSVSSGTIWRMCRRGELKPIKVAERVTAWRVGDVRQYLARAQGEAA